MITDPEERPEDKEEPPPFLGSWRNVYLLVIGAHVVTVVLLAILTYLVA